MTLIEQHRLLCKEEIFNVVLICFIFLTLFSPLTRGHLWSELLLVPIIIFFLLFYMGKEILMPNVKICILFFMTGLIIYISVYVNCLLAGGEIEKGNIYAAPYTYFVNFMIFFFTYNLSGKSTPKYFLISMVVAGFIIAIIGISQIFNLYNIPEIIDKYYSTETLTSDVGLIELFKFRATSVMDSNPSLLGGMLLWPIIIIMSTMFELNKSIVIKFLLSGLLLIILTCFFLTEAKTAIIAYIVFLFLFFYRKERIMLLLICFLFLFISYLFLRTLEFEDYTLGYLLRNYQELVTTGIVDSTSMQGRFYFWNYILNELDGIRMILGGGAILGEKLRVNDINNDSSYMFYLSYGGIAGLTSFLLLNAYIYLNLHKGLKRLWITLTDKVFIDSFYYFFLCSLILFITTGIGVTYPKWSYLFWLQLGIFLKMNYLHKTKSFSYCDTN